MTKQEEEYNEIEKQAILETSEEEYPEQYDRYSNNTCSNCGARLTVDEFEEFEDTCYECVWNDTGGLLDDQTEAELE